MKFTIIGVGNMGSAIVKNIIKNNLYKPEKLYLIDKNIKKLSEFKKLGCNISISKYNNEIIKKSDIILLALKPQSIKEYLQSIKSYLKKDVLIISIIAGINTKKLKNYSGINKIIRIMPNTPLLVNEGVSGYYITKEVKETEKINTKKILDCFGLSILCKNEDQIDSITALSGSGPAYYFYLLEHTIEKAKDLGFTKEESKNIALQTMKGSYELAMNSNKSIEDLRKNITSKGGTTESALNYFRNNELDKIWKEGIQSSYNRAKELL
jgi:pyrroline-5-carboxylate reductase